MIKAKETFKKALVLIMSAIIAMLYIAVPQPANAQTGFDVSDSIVLKEDRSVDQEASNLPQNYAKITNFSIKDADISYQPGSKGTIQKLDKYQAATAESDYTMYADIAQRTNGILAYYGTVNWGTANRTDTKGSVTKDTALGKIVMRWSNNVKLYDNMGKEIPEAAADLVMTIEPTVGIGKRPSDIKSTQNVYIPIVTSNNEDYIAFSAFNPRTKAEDAKSSIATDLRLSNKVTYEIMEHGTDTPISGTDFPSMLFGTKDLDAKDSTTPKNNTVDENAFAPFAESVQLVNGFQGGKIYVTDQSMVDVGELDGNQWIHPAGGEADDFNSLDSGFIVEANPQSYTYIWRGSRSSAHAAKDSSGKLAGRSMGTRFMSLDQLLMVSPVEIGYVWDSEASPSNPSPELPEGETEWMAGNEYTVSEKYAENVEFTDQDGQKWNFVGWKNNEDLQNPNYIQSKDKVNIEKDTIFVGYWKKTTPAPHKIITEVVGGTITPSDEKVMDGTDKVISYEPNAGYKIVSITVDGKEVSTTENPKEYVFKNVTEDHAIKVVYEPVDPEKPTITLSKSVSDETPELGDEITYTIEAVLDKPAAKLFGEEDNATEGQDADVVNEGNNTNQGTDVTNGEGSSSLEEENPDVLPDTPAQNPAAGTPAQTPATDTPATDTPAQTPAADTPAQTPAASASASMVKNVVISDQIPEGIKYVDDSVTVTGDKATAEVVDGKLTVKVPEFTNKVTITFKAIVTADEGRVLNTAVLTGDDIDRLEDNAVINVGEDPYEPEDPDEPELVKKVSKKNIKKGDTVTYTLVIRNDRLLENTVISDDLPKGMKLVKNSIKCSVKGGKVKVKGNSFTVRFKELDENLKVTYKAKAVKKGKHVNTAFLEADNLDDAIADDATVKVKTGSGSGTSKGNGPKTGDTNKLFIYTGILVAAICAYLIARSLKKKDNNGGDGNDKEKSSDDSNDSEEDSNVERQDANIEE